MRKFTFFMTALIGMSSVIFAQNYDLISSVNRTDRVSSQVNNSKSFSAEIVPGSKYVAGTSMDFKFTITHTSGDAEYGDYVEITFPAGLTPTDGSDPLTPLAGGSDNPMSLNTIEGQTISWGSQNSYGGMAPGTYDFFVTIKFDASATGDYSVNYTVSGDGYGNPPHDDVNGTLTILELPETPDLTIAAKGFMAEYYSVPLDQVLEFSQVTSTVQALIINEGDVLTEATNTTAKTAGDYSSEMPINVPLGVYGEDFVSYESFVATELGNHTFTFKADASNDDNPDNATATAEIAITETALIRDNGDVTGYFGVGSPDGMMGNVFLINNQDTLNSVTVFLGKPTMGDALTAVVYTMDENGPKIKIATSIPFVITEEDKEYNAYFADGLVLIPGKYFIGLVEGDNNMNIGITSTPFVDGTAWAYFSGAWNDLGAMGYTHTYYIRPGFGTELPPFDINLLDLDIYKYAVKGNELVIEGTLLNQGVDELTSIDIAYTVNGGDAVVESFTDLTVNGLYDFELTTPVDMAIVGDYNIKVYISNPNGDDDFDQTNDTIMTMVSAIEYAPTKSIFGEEATGTWCGWCVRGHVYMDSMKLKYPDTWIGVAVHNGDPMVVAEYDDAIGDFIPGYPSGLVNRSGVYDPSEFEEAYLDMIELPSPVSVSIHNASFNVDTKELKFDLSADFLATLKGAKFNAVIAENHVTGTSSGYNQANYYSGGNSGPMAGYEDLPDPVLADDMIYDHVARAILGGWDGTESSISAEVSAGDTESYSYTLTVGDDWNAEELEIIGMVISEDGSILNSVKGDIHTDIFDKKQNVDSFKAYPNPFNNTITIENLDNSSQIIISNILGQSVMTVNVIDNTMEINTSDLNKGVYLITIIDNDNNSRTERVVKQ